VKPVDNHALCPRQHLLPLVSVLVRSCASAKGNMKGRFVLGSATVYSRYAGQVWLTLLACRNKSWIHKFCEMIKALQSFRFARLLVPALISILQILCVTPLLSCLLFDRLPKTALLMNKTPAKMCKICPTALEATMSGKW